ncbi:restriction endonuclease subunit S [Pseudomonas aeruginosa]|uniref:restriction endonuclease subunit S n=1 Tax=Pseudomonas aeruginosa TaxID=287 RepID=UPI003D2664B2
MRIDPAIEAKYSRTRLKGGEVLLTLVGSVGQVAVASKSLKGFNVARAVAVIHPSHDVEPEWLAWCLRAPLSQHLLGSRANTTVQTTINLKDLRALPIPLPPEIERKEIIAVLGGLDDCISILRETNTTLEAMAQAIFKSWFVDFDPVRAKAEGRQPERMDAATAALFPDSFEESELGLVPKGWHVGSIEDIADYLNGLALQKFPPSEDSWLPVIKIAQLRRGNTHGADRASADIKKDYIVHSGDVLFSWSGTLEVEIWCGGKGALNQHLFKVTSKNFPKWFYLLWTKAHLKNFREIAASKATTMGHIQRKHLTEAKVVIPPDDVLNGAGAFIQSILDEWLVNAEEIQTLTQLRDTLLPKLISGEVRLPEAESIVRSAVNA